MSDQCTANERELIEVVMSWPYVHNNERVRKAKRAVEQERITPGAVEAYRASYRKALAALNEADELRRHLPESVVKEIRSEVDKELGG